MRSVVLTHCCRRRTTILEQALHGTCPMFLRNILHPPAGWLVQEARFIILEQAFLEALQAGRPAAALACLREQLAPLGVNHERLHQLAACLMNGGASTAGGLPALPNSGSEQEAGSPETAAAGQGAPGEAGAAALSASRHAVLRRLQASSRRVLPGCLCIAAAPAAPALCSPSRCPAHRQTWMCACLPCSEQQTPRNTHPSLPTHLPTAGSHPARPDAS